MKSRGFVVLASIISLSVALCLSNAFGWDGKYRQGFGLSSYVKMSNTIVVGRVTDIDFVVRPKVDPEITTDFTITVVQVLKGTPNAGNNKVKFTQRGGEYTNQETGKRLKVHLSSQPEFRVGEEILLFLYKGQGNYYKDYPHDRLQVLRGPYGKLRIRDNKVNMVYGMPDDSLKGVELPLEVALKLIEAADKDNDAVKPLENEMKAEMVRFVGSNKQLGQGLIERLKNESKKIIDKADAKKAATKKAK